MFFICQEFKIDQGPFWKPGAVLGPSRVEGERTQMVKVCSDCPPIPLTPRSALHPEEVESSSLFPPPNEPVLQRSYTLFFSPLPR